MVNARDTVEGWSWDSSTIPMLTWADRQSTNPEDAVDIAIFGSQNGFNAWRRGNPNASRFSPIEEVQNISALAVIDRASTSSHPYTKAIFLDFHHHIVTDKSSKRPAAIEAFNGYVVAISHFTNNGGDEYWVSVCDAINRCRELAITFGISQSDLYKVSLEFMQKLCSSRDIRLAINIAETLFGGENATISKAQLKSPASIDAWQCFGGLLSSCRKDLELLFRALKPLASHVPDRQKTLYELIANGALTSAAFQPPIAAIGHLQYASEELRSVGGSCLQQVLKALELTMPAVRDDLHEVPFSETTFDIKIFSPAVGKMSLMAPDTALAAFAIQLSHQFAPSPSLIDKYAASIKSNSVIRELVTVVTLDQHGPTTRKSDDIHAVDLLLGELSGLFRAAFIEESILSAVFSTNAISDLLIDSGIVPEVQRQSLGVGLHAWVGKQWVVANAVLGPITENAFCNFTSTTNGHNTTVYSRSNSASRKTGDALIEQVKSSLGESWCGVFNHLWVREGAIRHRFCHGYIEDELVSSVYCDYAILSLLMMSGKILAISISQNPPSPTS